MADTRNTAWKPRGRVRAPHDPRGRARTTNEPRALPGVDGRLKLMRRRNDLIELFKQELGGEPSGSHMLDIVRAAEATAIAEAYRARAFRGEPINMGDIVRVENVAERAVRRLAGPRRLSDPTPSLSDYLSRDRGVVL